MKKYALVLLIAIACLLNNINIASADIITSTVSLKRTGVSAGDTAVSSYSRGMVAYIEHAQAAYFLYILNHKPYAIDNHPLHFSVADNNYINGTMTLEVRRNDINGPLEYVETKSFAGDKYYEYLYFDIPVLNPFLVSGERLYYVINNQTNCRLRYYFYPTNDWKVLIQLYDQINADILREALAAKNNAEKARQFAEWANNNADLARQYAGWANGNAETAKNNILWGTDNGGKSLGATFDRAWEGANNSYYNGTYGGSSESVANVAGYIRNTQLPGLETKMNNLQVAVTNIQNSDTIPPTFDVQTVSGARATSASSIQAIVTVTDNRPGPYTYSISGGSYSTLPSDGRISLPVSSSGNNSITVSVKDVAGNIGTKTIVIRKL
ncbi:hypothetical protein Dred_0969 [Desulforamulus reducens MI-1]|uniref:Allergen V5/Tpx-1 family protein n=1 Tax=Desulforamulus reducens (strain ATCC BAA-1160 / DSM 100696 / MI-1) TaxID=349161 RepID=A4J351_DESRM|nr:hypothetical protein [Desulforamulus reducens]ABO49504.1 hypothetical protein Dred_0969 [Desulforamulus reducens MI-1]